MDEIVNAVLVKGAIDKLSSKIEIFNKTTTKLSVAMLILTGLMTVEIALQIWLTFK